MSRQQRRLSRRRFLQLALAAGAAASGGIGAFFARRAGSEAAAAFGPGARTATWTLSGSDLAAEPDHDGGTVLTSPVWTVAFPFNALGARWEGPGPAGGLPLQVDFRANDGAGWTPWLPAPAVHGLDGVSVLATDVVAVLGNAVQLRLRAGPGTPAFLEAPDRVMVTAIDTMAGPTADEADQTARSLESLPFVHAAIANPNQIGRLGWGANESYRFKNGKEIWAREYQAAKKIIVHHTVTANNDPDPAATVRAIYLYHAVTLGWGDTGYNFLVDRNGRVYEGRAGGINAQGLPVIGGHAFHYNAGSLGIALLGTFSDSATPVPDAMVQAIANLVSYKAVQHGIHPMASDFFVDKALPNIMGHRDCLSTICPGDAVYSLLPSLREQALANLPPLGQSWVRQQVPALMLPGATVGGTVTVRNSGSRTWTRGGTTPFRVGYRWFRAGGAEIREPGIEIHSDLPQDVLPGQEIAILLRIKAPAATGTLTLKIDMLQDGNTWFSSIPGNEPLITAVLVTSDLRYRTTLPWVTKGR